MKIRSPSRALLFLLALLTPLQVRAMDIKIEGQSVVMSESHSVM